MLSSLDDEQLAAKAAAGNRQAVMSLLDTYYDRIHAMAWRWCGQVEMAEDIAQDVCVKVATSIAKFRGDARFTTWLWRITYNTAIDHLRRARRLKAVEPQRMLSLVDGAAGETPESLAANNDLWRAVRDLPTQQRDAVLCVYAQDMSHAEAAEVLGCKESTVSWHLHEARKALRDILEAAE